MNLSGTTNTCSILTNTQFVLSGLSQSNLSTINVTDDNGLNVGECFGISTNIITVEGDNVTLTGDCNTSLEIIVTEGVNTEIECLYTGYTEQESGILLFEFADGSISENIHPECCTVLGYSPEIGPDMYYICRFREEIDLTDCDNYTLTGFYLGEYAVFNILGGGSTTVVPNIECCRNVGLVESIDVQGIHCIEDVALNGCEDLVAFPPDVFGQVWFNDISTVPPTIVTTVPIAECCTDLGPNYIATQNRFGDWACTFGSGGGDPTDDFYDECTLYNVDVGVVEGNGVNEIRIEYIDCAGEVAIYTTENGDSDTICSRGISLIRFTSANGDVETRTPFTGSYFSPRANISAVNSDGVTIGTILGLNSPC
jgi:hypothetical protein